MTSVIWYRVKLWVGPEKTCHPEPRRWRRTSPLLIATCLRPTPPNKWSINSLAEACGEPNVGSLGARRQPRDDTQSGVHNSMVGPRTCFSGAESGMTCGSQATMNHLVITFCWRCACLWLLGALAAPIVLA